MNKKYISILAIVMIFVSIGLVFIEQESAKDLIVNILTVLSLISAFAFYRKLKTNDGYGWMNFSMIFLLFCLFIVAFRVWDYMGFVEDIILFDLDSGVAEMYMKIGERLAFVLAGVFSISAIKELYNKMKSEVGLE